METIITNASTGPKAREYQQFPPAARLGDLKSDVECLGEGACDSRDGPQSDSHPEEEQLAPCLLLGPLDHP